LRHVSSETRSGRPTPNGGSERAAPRRGHPFCYDAPDDADDPLDCVGTGSVCGADQAGVSLVVVDFLALGRDGWPVADLKAEEVTLRVGGRARPIEALNLIDVVATGGPSPVSPLPPPFGTNIQSSDSRAFVLVVDD
jgi:hypothetical protein